MQKLRQEYIFLDEVALWLHPTSKLLPSMGQEIITALAVRKKL